MSSPNSSDVLLVGGGLANLLIGWRLAQLRPELSVGILEAGPEVAGNHTWSWHDTDLDAESATWVPNLASAQWDGYDVKFPGHARTLSGRYLSLASAELRHRIASRFGSGIRAGTRAARIGANGVTLDDGTTLTARLVIDGRGWSGGVSIPRGWQNFLGLEVELAGPHGLVRPVIMDATVDQQGGYRFIYLLPWTATSLLIEDTVYADHPVHDDPCSRLAIASYLGQRGWQVTHEIRVERGSLPIPLSGEFDQLPGSEAAVSGVRAGLFHATTGYSLPVAARIADLVARAPVLETAAVAATLRQAAQAHWDSQRFYRLLNRMLFRAAEPGQRYRVLERFYRLPETLIQRFYAGRATRVDQLRLLAGRPPVPIGRALRAALSSGAA